MKILKICLLLALITGPGCGLAQHSHREKVLRSSDLSPFGKPPPKDYQEALKARVIRNLKDPDSAKIEFIGKFAKQVAAVAFESEGKPAWVVPIFVNAKNSFGGYTGFTLWQAWWRDGEWVAIGACDEPAGSWLAADPTESRSRSRNWRICPAIEKHQLVSDSIASP